ncbi:MAG: hypothetical protein ACR2P8_02225 [Myxococcota bacterium]
MAGRDDERPDYLDREKKSFSELDKLRRERGSGADRPRGAAAEKRSQAAASQYRKEIDGMFGGHKEEVEQAGRAMLDARGTPGFAAACRAFLEQAGPPVELRYVSCFLDAGEGELVLVGLRALETMHAEGSLHATPGLRTQLRMLVEDPDDEVAGSAEDLLEVL